jgi:2'-5' RNA ligase
MTKERLKSPRARLFVALDLPDAVRGELVAWQRAALRDPALRVIAPEALHVTLCFLDYHPERAIERIAQVVCEIGPRPVTMRFQPEPIAVPRSRPRLFAVDAPSEGAVELQAELSDRLEEERFYEPEKRPFWSHLTVARVKPEKRASGQRRGRRGGRPMPIERGPGALPDVLLEPFTAPRVTLYRSFLHPAGARYVPLAGLDLSDPGG